MKFNILVGFFTLLVFSPFAVRAQELNAFDSNGKRHGQWKTYFDNNKSQPQFEGQFKHGKRIGLFKFYQQGLKQPIAVMEFDPASDRVQAKYLTQKGKVISEGEMLNEQRSGLWTYYHNNSDKVMMTENYINGKLEGTKKIFYDTGELAEEATYVKGDLHGPRKLYSEKGVVLEDLTYQEGELHGPAKFYNGKGELMSEGNYRNNQHHGVWRYYENGKLKEEKDF